MAWFRMYDDILADPKVLLLEPDVFKTWVFYLAAYKKYDGKLPDTRQLACLLRLNEQTLEAHMNTLVDMRLADVDGEVIRPHNWDKFQYESDQSRQRMKKLRERVGDGIVTSHRRHGDAQSPSHDRHNAVTHTVTSPSRRRHGDNYVTPPDTDTDTDTECVAVATPRAAAPPRQQQPEFLPFGDEPDVATLVSEAVEAVAQHWPMLGNVPNAKRIWERHARQAVEGPEQWCRKIQQTALAHSVAHTQCRRVNPRHFIPSLEKWVYDGDYSRPAPRVSESDVQPVKKSNLELAKELLAAQEKNHAH